MKPWDTLPAIIDELSTDQCLGKLVATAAVADFPHQHDPSMAVVISNFQIAIENCCYFNLAYNNVLVLYIAPTVKIYCHSMCCRVSPTIPIIRTSCTLIVCAWGVELAVISNERFISPLPHHNNINYLPLVVLLLLRSHRLFHLDSGSATNQHAGNILAHDSASQLVAPSLSTNTSITTSYTCGHSANNYSSSATVLTFSADLV